MVSIKQAANESVVWLLDEILDAGGEIKYSRQKIVKEGDKYEIYISKSVGSNYKLAGTYDSLVEALEELHVFIES